MNNDDFGIHINMNDAFLDSISNNILIQSKLDAILEFQIETLSHLKNIPIEVLREKEDQIREATTKRLIEAIKKNYPPKV